VEEGGDGGGGWGWSRSRDKSELRLSGLVVPAEPEEGGEPGRARRVRGEPTPWTVVAASRHSRAVFFCPTTNAQRKSLIGVSTMRLMVDKTKFRGARTVMTMGQAMSLRITFLFLGR